MLGKIQGKPNVRRAVQPLHVSIHQLPGQQFHLADVPSDCFRRRHSQKIRERAIQAQHSPVMVVHHDEISDRIKILNPLLPRSLDSREQAHVLQRH